MLLEYHVQLYYSIQERRLFLPALLEVGQQLERGE